MPEAAPSFDPANRGFGAGLFDAARAEVAADHRRVRQGEGQEADAGITRGRALRALVILLLLAAMVSAAGVIYLRHQHRLGYLALHAAEAERDRLNVEWGQLLLERATHTGQPIVEEQARRRLGMTVPAPSEIVILQIPSETHGRDR